jgi:hypothetical protein
LFAYRVSMTRHRKLGLREWDEKKTVPLATRQRVACILNYQAELPEDDRWDIKVEAAAVSDDWEPVDFTLPSSEDAFNYAHPEKRKVHLGRP